MTAPVEAAKRRRPPRERMVRAAAELIRTQGVNGTGLRDVVARADAPRGSLQHYFPRGKDQLVTEAIRFGAEVAVRRLDRYLQQLTQPTPGALFAAMVGDWRDLYARSGFVEGCPLAAAATDKAATSEVLRDAIRRAFDDWQQPLQEALQGLGVPATRTASLATLMISALEGALILARSRRETAPLDAVVAELRPLLDSAPAGSRRRLLPRAAR